MRNLVISLFLIASGLFFNVQTLQARHIVGGDFSYTFMGEMPNGEKQFRFTLNLYRDCLAGGANFDNPAQIGVYKGSWTNAVLFSSFEIPLSTVTKLDLISGCSNMSPNLCLEKGAYVFERTLAPAPGESYFFVYQRCCLAQTLTNIIAPGDRGSTYMVELTPEAFALNNSSPVFSAYPSLVACIHQPLSLPQNASDAEQDQLDYAFKAPYDGGGPILNPPGLFSCSGALPTPPCGPPFFVLDFVVPEFTPLAPMAGDPVVRIDSLTGVITGTPRKIGQFMAEIVCREQRNGVLLSTVRRSLVFNVIDDPLPVVEPAPAPVLVLSPNPARDWVSWPVELDIQEVRVFDPLGRCLKAVQGMTQPGMDLGELPAGRYTVRAITRTGVGLVGPLVVWR